MKMESFATKISNAAERVYQYRETIGNEVDLCIEIHRQLNVPEAIALGREIEKARPMFYEDPVRPDNFDDMQRVASEIHIPIATGERLHTLEEFGMLLARNACQYIRPGCVPVRRNYAGEKDSGCCGSKRCTGRASQSIKSGEHGSLPSSWRLPYRILPSRNIH